MVNQPLGVGGKRGAVGGVAQLACERVRQPSATVMPLEAASAGTGQADDRSCCRVELGSSTPPSSGMVDIV